MENERYLFVTSDDNVSRIIDFIWPVYKEIFGIEKMYGKQRFTRGYKRYKEISGLMEWKIGHIFHSIFT